MQAPSDGAPKDPANIASKNNAINGQGRTLEVFNGRFEKYILYETTSFYYLVGTTAAEERYRVIKINRVLEKPSSLAAILQEDDNEYSRQEISEMLDMIDDGNKSSGGLNQVVVACGIFGFIRFLDCYYMNLITERKKVGKIGSNFIYCVKASEVIAIKPKEKSGKNPLAKMWSKVAKKMNQTSTDTAESKYMGLYQFLDITKDFFFSYSYDLTNSLQHNFVVSSNKSYPPPPSQDMFEWNHYQMEEFRSVLGSMSAAIWTVPCIHGSFQQKMFSIFGRTLLMTLMARRSRHYAGTRYLKRGVNVHGRVANDCEIEEILQYEDGKLANYSSYLQHRGSIPTYWAQETSVTMPKPPILISRVDPTFRATQEHFADLFSRYGAPVIVLDLVKQNEKKPRESLIGDCFRQGIQTINEHIDDDCKIRYCAMDFSRVSKSHNNATTQSPVRTSPEMLETSSSLETLPKSTSHSSLSNKVRADSAVTIDESYLDTSKYLNDQIDERNKVSANSASEVAPSKDFGDRSPEPFIEEGDKDSYTFAPIVSKTKVESSTNQTDYGDGSNFDTQPTIGKIDVFQELQDIAAWCISETSIFCSTTNYLVREPLISAEERERGFKEGYIMQKGVARTNCVDCLDRTNVGQFALGVRFLSVSLQVMGLSDHLISSPSNSLVVTLMDMYSEMGDRIALQYGGSEAHSKMGQSGSSLKGSGELLTSIKRYYSNSFTDRVKQDAINLFLGNFVPMNSRVSLWELDSDYHLHNKTLRPPWTFSDKLLYSTAGNAMLSNSSESDECGECVVDQGNSLHQYMIGPLVDPASADKAIKRKELRKLRHKEKSSQIKEALREWWELSIHEHSVRDQWHCVKLGEDQESEWTSFDRIYNPDKLTSFDSIIANDEFSCPIVIDSNTHEITKWKEKSLVLDSRKEKDTKGSDNSDPSKKSRANSWNKTDSSMLGKIGTLAGHIGMKASRFVGGIGSFLRRDDGVEDCSYDQAKASEVSPYERTGETSQQHDLYTMYVNASDILSKDLKGYGTSEHEFQQCMDDFTIDLNDAVKMKALMKNSSIVYNIEEGEYGGMKFNDSVVVDHTGPLFRTLVAFESRMEFKGKNDDFSVASLPSLNVDPYSYGADLILSAETTSRLEKVSKINHFPSGLELELQVKCSQFLIDQAMYHREIVAEKISRKTSTLSTPKTLLKYASYFEKESLVSEYSQLVSSYGEVSKSNNDAEMEDLLISLNPLYELYKTLKTSEGLQGDVDTHLPSSTFAEMHTLNSWHQPEKDKASSSGKEYQGFKEISYDLYVKLNNPYFRMNEIGVVCYLHAKKRREQFNSIVAMNGVW